MYTYTIIILSFISNSTKHVKLFYMIMNIYIVINNMKHIR